MLATTALAGCAGLQIDVDVYKGPLANSGETQKQQLVSMAMSAKPLIVEYRNDVLLQLLPDKRETLEGDFIRSARWKALAEKIEAADGGLDAEKRKQLRHARQLNGILSFYKDLCLDGSQQRKSGADSCVEPDAAETFGFGYGRGQAGIEKLAMMILSPLPSPQSAGLARKEAEPVRASDLLDSTLVDFAARVQFYTNNQWILDAVSAQPKKDVDWNQMFSSAVQKALGQRGDQLKTLLETVSNTILVQADELRRSNAHAEHLKRFSGTERWAARNVLLPNAQKIYDDIRTKLSESLRPAAEASAPKAASEGETQGVELAKAAGDRKAAVRQAYAAAFLFAAKAPDEKQLKAASQLGLPVLSASQLASFQSAVRSSVAGSSTVTFTQMKSDIDQWATRRLRTDQDLPEALRAQVPEYAFVQAAKDGAAALELAEPGKVLARPTAFGELAKAAQSRLADAIAAYDKVVALQARFPAPAAPQGAATPAGPARDVLTAEQYGSLDALLRRLKGDVVAATLKASEAVDAGGVKSQLESLLQKEFEAGKQQGKQLPEVTAALKVLKGMQFRKPIGEAPEEAQDSIEVLESYIATLRYQYLDAVRTEGDESTEAKKIAAALVQARKQRADMVHVRPSSAYLRSSLAATFAQENPYVQWKNMLNDTMQALGRNLFSTGAENKTREDLDKVFWQNINRVRLNAGGLTNYILAKDDVGNWYVKGMGSDPSAMINAAKNLALYNLGGRLDTNLLRMDELRNKLDNDRNASTEQRTGWTDELDKLGGSQSGPVVADRSGTVKIFQDSYAKQTADHLNKLVNALQTNEYRIEIARRWAEMSPTPSASILGTLTATMAQPSMEALWKQAASEAVTSDTRSAADAIVAALQALERYRASLRAAVVGNADLLGGADGALQDLRRSVPQREQNLALAASALQTRASAVTAASANLGTADDPALRRALNEAVSLHAQAMANHDKELKALADLRTEIESRTTLLRAALLQRQRAADDVDAVLKGRIGDWVTARLRTVDELETAAKVVGRRTP